jgi:LysM repeat protein
MRPSISATVLCAATAITAALAAAGCSMQQSSAEQPDWSLNSGKTKTASAKNYGDWNGAGAPKPLTVDEPKYVYRGGRDAVTGSALPPIETPAPAAAKSSLTGRTVTVAPGDTLSGISRRTNVSVARLMQANDLRDARIVPGQNLKLPE